MEVKPTVVVLLVMTLVVNLVVAEFFYNHVSSKHTQAAAEYKCVPGRTIIKVSENLDHLIVHEETDSEEYRQRRSPNRKAHMTSRTRDESCKICICSAEGKDEYCSNRAAESVNECLMMKDITDKFNMGLPYEHSSSLAYRIRRVNNVGDKRSKKNCVPFISEYTNCDEDNICSGCSQCKCDGDGQWACQDVQQCPEDNNGPDAVLKQDQEIFDDALEMLEANINKKKKKNIKVMSSPNVPAPQPKVTLSEPDDLLGYLVAIPRQEH